MVTVRYIVNDVGAAVAFHKDLFGFKVEMQPGPGFAMLSLGDLQLALNGTRGAGGASKPMPDGRKPEPGGWNRAQLTVADIDEAVEQLRSGMPRTSTGYPPQGDRLLGPSRGAPLYSGRCSRPTGRRVPCTAPTRTPAAPSSSWQQRGRLPPPQGGVGCATDQAHWTWPRDEGPAR